MKRLIVALAAALGLAGAAHGAPNGAHRGPEILTSDVDRFYAVYTQADGHPSAEALARDYLAPGTAGLHDFAKARNVTAERIAANIAAHPEQYEKARSCLKVLPQVKRELTAAFAKLAAAYPEAKFPPVTIVVGRGKPVGITDPSGVTIGLEAMCRADFMNPDLTARFVHNIAHEYGHIQQSQAQQDLDIGKPGATVLTMSLMEGAAEFTAELISGDIGQSQERDWVRGREREIGEAFLRDQDKTDLSAWMYNGPGTKAKPSDLGYWVGWRIVKAYYDRAADKHAALAAIFQMKDAKAFLAESGWTPGA